jgi:hypothetical protein
MTAAHEPLAETGWTPRTAATGRQLAERFLTGLTGTGSLTAGTNTRGLRLISGDRDVDCRIDGPQVRLEGRFVEKA